ncbi:hypothetical protein AKJ51_01440 [candidate division MSBL1 archaeon SCGC-AAA382A20]|uniref:Uncharacterized protein n=1 Tax=candidate division MSBL1 archaeon SCGC-AAA382A20 TaxID=1698280 RepID=A0A133VLQ5_9EURY|nr:hypothetical protein AKJ51_01440 [candidate division MSBL1 archaeon SCGC-AAA382A20]
MKNLNGIIRRGWFFDNYRHALASQGIKTKLNNQINSKVPPRDLYPLDWDDMFAIVDEEGWEGGELARLEAGGENLIYLFWWSSVNDNWEYFDFKKAFKSVEFAIENYINFSLHHDDEYVTLDEVVNLSVEEKRGFGTWGGDPMIRAKIINLYDEVVKAQRNIRDMTLSEKISLFDKVLDTEHQNGIVWRYLDSIPKLRERFKRWYV